MTQKIIHSNNLPPLSSKYRNSFSETTLYKACDDSCRLYSPIYDCTCTLKNESIQIENRIYTLNEFTNYSLQTDERDRMFRYAFLIPPRKYHAVNIELTHSCTLHCPHCFIEDAHEHESHNKLYNIDNLSKILEYNPQEITLTGGELLQVDNFDKVLYQLDKYAVNKNIIVRLLGNGTWFYNKQKVQKLLSTINDMENISIQFRFTLFDSSSHYHDLLCGSYGNYSALLKFIDNLKQEKISYSINYAVTTLTIENCKNIYLELKKIFGYNITVSTIIYHSQHAHNSVEKLLITPEQYASLIQKAPFSPLTSQYCDTNNQCNYHCNYPLLTYNGLVCHCNLPGTQQLSNPVNKNNPDCDVCDIKKFCKQCPNACPAYLDRYCPYVRASYNVIQKRIAHAITNDYQYLYNQDLAQSLRKSPSF